MTAPETMTMNCPNEETLAAFVDGRLKGEARRRIVEHLADCGECRDLVVGVAEVQEPPAEILRADVVGSPSRFWGRIAAVAAGIALLLLGASAWQRFSQPSSVETLVEAAGALESRPMLARVAMPLAWKPLERTVRSGAGRGPDLAVLVATERIAEIAKRDRSTENIRALAVANLFRREPDDAISALEGVLLRETGETSIERAIDKGDDEALLVDLSAAYLTRARRSEATRDTSLARASVQRAWLLGKTPAAAWNRALSLEESGLEDAATSAWQDYLHLDPASEWATEARERIDRIAVRKGEARSRP